MLLTGQASRSTGTAHKHIATNAVFIISYLLYCTGSEVEESPESTAGGNIMGMEVVVNLRDLTLTSFDVNSIPLVLKEHEMHHKLNF